MTGWSQERTLVHIEHANQFHKTSGSDAVRLIGNVHIRHDSTHFYCDSAYYYEKRNSFDAYQNVHINVNDSIDMYCTTMNYDGDLRFAEFFNEVKMKDDSTLLETDYMTYDRDQHLACYPHHGVTTRGDKMLVSELGYYRDDLKEFRFFQKVEVTSPKYQMFTDTLIYNTRIEKMWFEGPTTIINEENTMEGEHGYYLTELDLAYLDKNPVIYNETQRMWADSMLYDRLHGFAKAMNTVQMIDTAYKVIMQGEYVEVWEKIGYSFATDSAHVTYYDGGDSLYIASDTMFYHFKTELNDEEKIIGRRNVRFYKSDMQGQCDTMTYLTADSTIRMRNHPVLWADDAQMTGDSIDIKVVHRNIDHVVQHGNAFIIAADSVEGYNQFKGALMVSHFDDGALQRVEVTGDAKTISWLREDDQSLIGINVASAQNMEMLMKDNNIDLVKYFKSIDETLYPEKDLKENDRYLEGFNWREEEKPKDKNDIFKARSL
jgi:lipopolysaccharide export system protein LptA